MSEKSCETCVLFSHCGYIVKDIHCWRPKEKEMRKPIFENKEEAILIMKSVVIRSREWELNIPETLKAWREEGYIRSSPVEEAEEIYKRWKIENCENHNRWSWDNMAKLICDLYEAIQHLKSKLEEKK